MDAADRAAPLHRDDFTTLGPYRLVGRLGEGGMGVVYLGLDEHNRHVAVKLVHARLADDPEFSNRFRSEVERARAVPSFCTAEVLDADLDHNPPYLVVEYVDGPSLAQTVRNHGPLSPSHLHSVAVGVATALTGIHGAGVIHRDLKPENVLLAPGSPKVIDFGIARAFEVTSEYTRTGQWVGTVSYMAPERFSNAPATPLTPAADIFAWGCVIAFAGTGRTPFHGDSPEATAARILTQKPYLDGLSEPLRGLVEAAVAKHAADRPTARELLDLLVSGPGLAPSPNARARAAGLPPAVAALLPPTGPAAPVRNAAPDSRVSGLRPPVSGLRPEVAAFLTPAAEPAEHPSSPAPPFPAQASPPRSPAARPSTPVPPADRRSVPRQSGLRPGVAEFVGSSPDHPDAVSAYIGAGPAGHSASRPRRSLPAELTNRLHGVRGLTTSALIGAAILAVVVAGVKLTGHDDKHVTPGQAPSAATLGALSGTAEPNWGDPDVSDPLRAPGNWRASHIGAGKCAFVGTALEVSRDDRQENGQYRCAGPADAFPGDFGLDVTVRLRSAVACAAIWFHASGGTGGQSLLVCPDGTALGAADRTTEDRFPQSKPIALGQDVAIRLAVNHRIASVWQDGLYTGHLPLPAGSPGAGDIQLGISIPGGDPPPPYAVDFADVRIWSI